MIRYFVRHPVAANILMVSAVILGLSVIRDMERESFPEFTASRVSVTVLYPGAAAIDVDEQVCAEIDSALNGLTDLDEIECQSVEGRASATLTMAEGGDISQFFNDTLSEVQALSDRLVDAASAALPPDILDRLAAARAARAANRKSKGDFFITSPCSIWSAPPEGRV